MGRGVPAEPFFPVSLLQVTLGAEIHLTDGGWSGNLILALEAAYAAEGAKTFHSFAFRKVVVSWKPENFS